MQAQVETDVLLGRLHEVNLALLGEETLPTLLKTVNDAAVELSRADMGAIQLYDRRTDALTLVAHKGFDQCFLERVEIVDASDHAVWGEALRQGRRVIVDDVWRAQSAADDPSMEILRAAAVRAVQATALRARDGAVLGVMATHWKKPHQPDATTLLALDLLAQQVADLIAYRQNRHTLLVTNARIEEFLDILAHELRNPLAAIFSGLQALCKTAWSGGATPPMLALIERQTNHLVRLVDDLLEASRITNGRIQLKKERIDLAEAVDDAINIASDRLLRAGLRLRVVRSDQPLMMDADRVRLTQLFSSLLDNAAEFTQPGGEVNLVVESGNGEASVVVSDNGMGIAPSNLSNIFTLFSQEAVSRQESGGAGIGLPLARIVAQAHGGFLEAHSEGEGRGTRVVVRLPLLQSVPRSARSAVLRGAD